jgi:hypothetical protein
MDNLLLAFSDVQIRPKVGFAPAPDIETFSKAAVRSILPSLRPTCSLTSSGAATSARLSIVGVLNHLFSLRLKVQNL